MQNSAMVFIGDDKRWTVVFRVGGCSSRQTHPDPAHHVPTKGPGEVTGDASGAVVGLWGSQAWGGGDFRPPAFLRGLGYARG